MRFQIKNNINKIGVKKLIDMMISPVVYQNVYVTSSRYFEDKFLLSSIISNEPLGEEREYFKSIREELKKDPKHIDQYVAILKKEKIGFGSNGAELAIKMYKKYGYIPILIEKINEDVIYTSSPRIV